MRGDLFGYVSFAQHNASLAIWPVLVPAPDDKLVTLCDICMPELGRGYQ